MRTTDWSLSIDLETLAGISVFFSRFYRDVSSRKTCLWIYVVVKMKQQNRSTTASSSPMLVVSNTCVTHIFNKNKYTIRTFLEEMSHVTYILEPGSNIRRCLDNWTVWINENVGRAICVKGYQNTLHDVYRCSANSNGNFIGSVIKVLKEREQANSHSVNYKQETLGYAKVPSILRWEGYNNREQLLSLLFNCSFFLSL